MVKAAAFGIALLSGVSLAVAGVIEPSSSSGATVRKTRREDLRLVKTSEEDPGTWMTEEEKFDKFISKKIGFMDITDTQELESLGQKNSARDTISIRAIPSGPSHQSEATPLISQANIANLRTWANEMADFYNRYYRGSYASTSATWMYNTVLEVASANSKIQVSRYTHSYNQPSVIAKIPGSSSSVVIVSAHYDSIGSTTSGRAPGADDNASGVVVVLEALRILASAGYSPKNTLEFHFYSGEEGGLLGSRDIMQSYASSGVNVLAMVNQDMTGYSPNNVIAVYTDYVNTALTNFVMTLVPVYTDLELSTDKCGYGCSDHSSANSAGFPAAYVCDENMADSSPYIHSAQDTISTLSFEHILQHVKFTVGFLVEGAYF